MINLGDIVRLKAYANSKPARVIKMFLYDEVKIRYLASGVTRRVPIHELMKVEEPMTYKMHPAYGKVKILKEQPGGPMVLVETEQGYWRLCHDYNLAEIPSRIAVLDGGRTGILVTDYPQIEAGMTLRIDGDIREVIAINTYHPALMSFSSLEILETTVLK